MRYTVLIDESSDLRIMNLIEKFDLGKEINSKFFIPVYSYIIFEGKVELNFTKKGLVKVDNNIIKTEVKELELGKNLDDATMEGIKRSLKYLIKRGYTDDVVIYSDRKTVIDCINNQSKYYAEVKDLIDKFNIIKFTWIPRTFNGWADKLAREERKKTTNISIELFEEILNKLIVIKETNELYLETLSNFNNEKQINTNLRRKIDNLENTIMQIRKSNRNLKTINKKLETNKDTYKNIIEKQNKEIQKFNSLYSENENNKYIIRQQGSKIKDLRDINKELLDDLQYYKRKFQELKNENNDLVKKLDEKYKEEFLEEFEMVGSSKEL